MPHDKELEIQLQFLEEAQEYLNTIESVLLGLASQRLDPSKMDAALRAAHSVKGGAAMMGFETLSLLAHRLEDFLKVLRAQKPDLSVDVGLERLMLATVDVLRQVISLSRQTPTVAERWLELHARPILNLLQHRLGDPPPEDLSTLSAPEPGRDTTALLLETEVEGCLQRLESVLEDPQQPCLREELAIMAQELGGLGEMLQLRAFSQLCESIGQHLEAAPERLVEIAQLALHEWRRSKSLVLAGQTEHLPTQLLLDAKQLVTAATEPALAGPPLAAPAAWPVLPASADLELPPEPSPAPQPSESQENTVRVPVQQLEQLSDLFGELTIERNGLGLNLERLHGLTQLLSQRVRSLEQSSQRLQTTYDKAATQGEPVAAPLPLVAPGSPVPAAFDPAGSSSLNSSPNSRFDSLEMDRYGELHLLSQEVMETLVQIQEVTGDLELGLEDTDQTARDLNRTAKQLQTSLTQARMRPLCDLLNRFPRVLRDLSLQYGKQAELKVSGGNTLIDRSLLEALSDPLLHLLRNAFDHGIEDPATRRMRGKPETGQIEIRATYRGSQTLITVSDDGGGINLTKIRSRAQQIGLDADLLASASERELLALIFEPGFSTANQVTALSGRGVGMDVVRTNLKQVRGEIRVETQAGQGSVFTISLPLTLSVVRVLLVESHGMLMAFPTDAVEAMLLLKPGPVIAEQAVLSREGEPVPLLSLKPWLNFRCPTKAADTEATPTIGEPTALVLAQAQQRISVRVERCWGEQEVAVRQVEGNLPLPPGFTGCTILGDGRVVPLVDVPQLVQWLTNHDQSASPDGPTPNRLTPLLSAPFEPSSPSLRPSRQTDTILIVDDSINVRRFLALTLEKAGYRVEQARDGQDALEKLLAGLPVQAVVCDIEMPRLSGYGLLTRLKSEPNLQHLPVAMLTSRSGDKHRQLAMGLGARAYFSKPYKEQDLLQTLRELIQEPLVSQVS